MRTTVLHALAWSSLGVAGCVAPAPRAEPRPAAPVSPLDPARTVPELIDAHNRVRTRAGMPPLGVSERLSDAARRHADDMAARRRMSHRGGDGSTPFRRMARAGYTYQSAAENIAYGQPTPAAVMSAWMASPGHRRNILGKYAEIGAAYATDRNGTPCWCVTFGTPAGG